MQVFIVVALFLLILMFGLTEEMKSSRVNQQTNESYLADFVAENIVQFNNLTAQYVANNYATLHELNATTIGNVEIINIINSSQYAAYDQKNTNYLLNYSAVVFNYTHSGNNATTAPTLYLATTWSAFSATANPRFLAVNLAEVMGKLNQISINPVYQATSTYWTVPWLVTQNNCVLSTIYTQLPDASSAPNIKTFFTSICNFIKNNSAFVWGVYVYVQPIYLPRTR